MKPFNAKSWEVRAWLEGRKTQFRRVNKLATKKSWRLTRMQSGYPDGARPIWGDDDEPNLCSQKCPYVAGQRLWVRETWCEASPEHRDTPGARQAFYRADSPSVEGDEARLQYIRLGHDYRWRPSIHMPRWASRLTLEITAVRVERLQDISEEDAKAEGCDGDCQIGYIPAYQKAPCLYHFHQVFESCYLGSWDANPWVWVVETKVVT